MKISEIKSGMKDIALEAKVKEISEPRPVQTKFGPSMVANATLDDGSATIDLVLWGKKISDVSVGSKVSITGGYVTEWKDKKQLNVPKTGQMTVE